MEEIKSVIEKATKARKPAPVNPALDYGKIPPQAVELEEAVLGAIMLEKDAYTAVIDILKPEIFYKPIHQTIFQAIQSLFQKSEPIDILTVTQELKEKGSWKLLEALTTSLR